MKRKITDWSKSQILSTEDSIKLLNEQLGEHKWKRTAKFKLNEYTVRVFSNTDGILVTLITHPDKSYTILEDFDLSIHMDLIKRIQKIATNYYTHDYGNLWFNPTDMSIWASGGDGGYFYSTLPKSKVEKILEDSDGSEFMGNSFMGESFIEIHHQPSIPEIKDSIWEAEADPYEDDGWILIGEISLIG